MEDKEKIKKIIDEVTTEDIKENLKKGINFNERVEYNIYGPVTFIINKEVKKEDVIKKIENNTLEDIKENFLRLAPSELINSPKEELKIYFTNSASGTTAVSAASPNQDEFLKTTTVLPNLQSQTPIYQPNINIQKVTLLNKGDDIKIEISKKEQDKEEIFKFEPEFHGIGIRIRPLFKKLKNIFKK